MFSWPRARRQACAGCPDKSTRVVRFVTLNSPTSFYSWCAGEEGFEFQLASALRRRMGVKLLMYPVADVRALQAELAAGRADIAQRN